MTARHGIPDEAPRPCPFDHDGFLVSPSDWSEEAAEFIATADGLELTDAHWRVIRLLREHYVRTGTGPSMRDLRQATGLPARDLFTLFPAGGPLMQGVKIAGLPKPAGCK